MIGMDNDGLFFFLNLYVRKMSRRNLSFGLLLGAVAARASCYGCCSLSEGGGSSSRHTSLPGHRV